VELPFSRDVVTGKTSFSGHSRKLKELGTPCGTLGTGAFKPPAPELASSDAYLLISIFISEFDVDPSRWAEYRAFRMNFGCW